MLNKLFRNLKLLYFNWDLLYKIFKTYNFYYLQNNTGTVKESTKIVFGTTEVR